MIFSGDNRTDNTMNGDFFLDIFIRKIIARYSYHPVTPRDTPYTYMRVKGVNACFRRVCQFAQECVYIITAVLRY